MLVNCNNVHSIHLDSVVPSSFTSHLRNRNSHYTYSTPTTKMRRSLLSKMNVWSEDEEYALAFSFVHVRAESTTAYCLVPDFWDRVKDRFDGEFIFVGERTKDQILLKWGKMASVLEKFQRIYSRLMGTGCLVDVRIDEAVVHEAYAEYARVYGRPFAKLAIWRLLTVN